MPRAQPGQPQPPEPPELSVTVPSLMYSSAVPSGRILGPGLWAGLRNLNGLERSGFLEGELEEGRILMPPDFAGLGLLDLDDLGLLEREGFERDGLEPLEPRDFFNRDPFRLQGCYCVCTSVRACISAHHSSSVMTVSALSEKTSSMGIEHHVSPKETTTSRMDQGFSMSTPLDTA